MKEVAEGRKQKNHKTGTADRKTYPLSWLVKDYQMGFQGKTESPPKTGGERKSGKNNIEGELQRKKIHSQGTGVFSLHPR